MPFVFGLHAPESASGFVKWISVIITIPREPLFCTHFRAGGRPNGVSGLGTVCSSSRCQHWSPGHMGPGVAREMGSPASLFPPRWVRGNPGRGVPRGSLSPWGLPAWFPDERLWGAVHHLGSRMWFSFFSSCPSGMTHLRLSLWFSQKQKVCLLKCRLTCFFYKFLGITIDFWLRVSKSCV